MSESAAALESRITQVTRRAMYEYNVPQSVRDMAEEPCPETVGLRVLTSREELMASKLGNFDFMRAQYEALKLAICAIDGNKVTDAAGEISKVWETWPPALRSLLVQAYNKLSAPTEKEKAGFFLSMKMRVG